MHKLNTNQFVCNYKAIPHKQTLQEMILDFLSPFYYGIKQNNLKVQVVELNRIPRWAATDWNIHK